MSTKILNLAVLLSVGAIGFLVFSVLDAMAETQIEHLRYGGGKWVFAASMTLFAIMSLFLKDGKR